MLLRTPSKPARSLRRDVACASQEAKTRNASIATAIRREHRRARINFPAGGREREVVCRLAQGMAVPGPLGGVYANVVPKERPATILDNSFYQNDFFQCL